MTVHPIESRWKLTLVASLLLIPLTQFASGQKSLPSGSVSEPAVASQSRGSRSQIGPIVTTSKVKTQPTQVHVDDGSLPTAKKLAATKQQEISQAREFELPEPLIAPEPIAGKEIIRKQPRPSLNTVLEVIQFDDVPLGDAMRLFAEQSGLNVITSNDAGKTKVTVYLKNVTAIAALEAIVKANGLFYRVDEQSGIVRIATTNEYEKDLASFREEETCVFTLLYPNPVAVAQVIQQVFGSRVQYNTADTDFSDLADLSQRFSRFDLVDGRSLGLGTFDSSGSSGGIGSGLNGVGGNLLGAGGLGGNALTGLLGGSAVGSGLASGSGLTNRSRSRNGQQFPLLPAAEKLNDLSSEDIQRIENQIAQRGDISDEERANLLQRRQATIFVSTIRRNNQVIVRTGDARSMEQIDRLIQQLDVPTPTVLLEVKVLRVALADGLNSAFEYFAGGDDEALAFSDGNLAPPFPGANPASRTLPKGLGVSGSIPGALTFQIVDSNFQFRMQLLESKSRVTALATPLILTANNEVSRIFVGDTLPFTVGFTPSQVIGSLNSVNGAVAATPITELRDVGQSLLITPNINADRTVTLRVVEENSERVVAGASIPIPSADGSGVIPVPIDTVKRRTVSGTVVAQDGMAVALGGLIEEQVTDARDQIPILGNIPGIGFLFRRQSTYRSRSELVVVIRPYVFNTPSESAATSRQLLGELSMHPSSPDVTDSLNDNMPCQVIRSDPECSQRAKLFRLHNVTPAVN